MWHWIFSWASDRSVDVEEVQPLAYSNMTGSQLCQMSRTDFVNINPKYGAHIFETLQQLSNQFREMSKCFSLSLPFSLSLHLQKVFCKKIYFHGSKFRIKLIEKLILPVTGSNLSTGTVSSASTSSDFMTSLPSFDILRSSCLDLDCHGSSPSSNGNFFLAPFLTHLIFFLANFLPMQFPLIVNLKICNN